jgi:hypothetical protein
MNEKDSQKLIDLAKQKLTKGVTKKVGKRGFGKKLYYKLREPSNFEGSLKVAI